MDKPATLIIGPDPALGDALVHRFLAAGHDVVAVSPDNETLDALKTTFGHKIICHHGPAHSKLGLGNSLAAVRETGRTVDNVVCIPPVPNCANLLELDMGDFEDALLQAVHGSVQVLRVFSPAMINERRDPENAATRIRQTGTFTFILSLNALMSQPGWFGESVCQHAISGIVRAGAIELSADSIRVNAVIALRANPKGREPWLRERTPMGRAAHDEEIAETAVFLAGQGSAIITGESIILDGGRSKLSGQTGRPGGDRKTDTPQDKV